MGIWMTTMTLDPTLACRGLIKFKLRSLDTSLHSRIFVFEKGVIFSSRVPSAVGACMSYRHACLVFLLLQLASCYDISISQIKTSFHLGSDGVVAHYYTILAA
jgi:hypothetical protein